MKLTIKNFIKHKLDISNRDPCLCMVVGDKFSSDCNWFDKPLPNWPRGWWQICILEDGTAVTWCLDE